MAGHNGCAHNRDRCIDRSPSNRVHAAMHTYSIHTHSHNACTEAMMVVMCIGVEPYVGLHSNVKQQNKGKTAYGKRPAMIMSEFMASMKDYADNQIYL